MTTERVMRVRIGETSVELVDEHGHDLEDDSWHLACRLIDEAVAVGGGDAYHPNDGDTYIYGPRDLEAVVGVLVVGIAGAGYQAVVEQREEPEAS